MYFKNSRLWVQHRPSVVVRDSILILLGTFVLRYAIHDLIEPYGAFHLFMVACIVVAIRYGYKAAIACQIASLFLANFFFVKPYGSWGPITDADFIKMFDFLLVTGVAVLLIERLQRTVYSQKLMILVMRDRKRSTLFRQNELLQKLKSAGIAP
jgi:K+-sensing histidine kinase KdpD